MCQGTGEIGHLRCPSSMTDAEGRAAAAAASYASAGILATSGGWGEQRSRGAQLSNVAAMEMRLIREAEAESD